MILSLRLIANALIEPPALRARFRGYRRPSVTLQALRLLGVVLSELAWFDIADPGLARSRRPRAPVRMALRDFAATASVTLEV